jgi:zinc protease
MKPVFCSCLLILLLAGCSPSLPTQQVRPDQLTFPELQFVFPDVEKRQLANGMKLFLKEDHELPLVEMTLMIGGGSILDPMAKTGLSSLFAAVLETGGAGDLPPLALETELEAMAAELSVSSSAYGYSIDMSIHQQDLQRGIEILADLLRQPRFDMERLELARKQLLESIRRKNDDPASIASRLLAEAVYPQHPFGSTPQEESVEKFNRDDLLQLHQRYFKPNNLWLAVSGSVTADALTDLLNRHFADWPSAGFTTDTLPPLPPVPDSRILIADKDIPQTSIMLGHPGINKDNPDLFALRVANYILGGGGFNSRLMQEIRSNRGLAYSVYSYFQVGRRLPELFIVSGETKNESTAEVIELMRQQMERIRLEPVSDAELDLAKQSLINSFVFAFNNTHSIVSRKVRLEYYDYPPDYLESYRDKIAAVTVADVQRVARTYLHPDRLQIVLVGDSSKYLDAIKSFGMPVEKVEL